MALKREMRLFPKIFNMLNYILKNLSSRNILDIFFKKFSNFSPRGWLHDQFKPRLKYSYKSFSYQREKQTERTKLCGI